MSANDYQVGGNHYRKGDSNQEQHWDRMWRLFGRGYFIGCITKYVERYTDKNGLQDLDKAIHFAQKLRELEEAASNGTGPLPGGGNKPLIRIKDGIPAMMEAFRAVGEKIVVGARVPPVPPVLQVPSTFSQEIRKEATDPKEYE